MNEIVAIPEAVLLSEPYTELNTKQRSHFASRLNTYLEIVVNVMQANLQSKTNLESLIEDIELDSSSINMSYSDVNAGLSVYLINTLLTADCDISALQENLDKTFKDIIEKTSNSAHCSFEDMCDWLNQWAFSVKGEISAFSESKTYDAAMAHLLVIIALMSLVTCATSLARLNPNVYS